MRSSDAPDVRRVPVSTERGSGPEGGNSAYVLQDSGVVVDPGPPGDVAWSQFRDGLTDAGLAVEDVSAVAVTHWHADHAGLAPRLADAADAPLSLHENDAPLVADYAVERERRLERDAATLARWGVPDERVRPLIDADSSSPVPDSFPVEALVDGDRVGPLESVHTPGHTAGHCAFAFGREARKAAGFVGDALLRTVTPNVGGGDTRQENPLAAYRGTLSGLDDRFDVAHPGHGTAFDVAPRVAELREHHRDRAGRTLDALGRLAETAETAETADTPGVTPWAVAAELFGEMTGYHVKFGAGEAFAHLADLAELGLVELVAHEPLAYAPAADGGDDGDGSEATARLDAIWNDD